MGNIEEFLTLADGSTLFYRLKEIDSPYWIIATHGIGEHSGRHKYLESLFGDRFNLFKYDLRGHGKSSGERGQINDFDQYQDDLAEIIHFLKTKYKMSKYILFGHSMGALITAAHLQAQNIDPDLQFVYLSSPPVGIGGGLGEIVKKIPSELFGYLSKFKKGMMLPGMVDLKSLSSDASVGQKYLDDPLTLKTLHSNLLISLVAKAKSVFARPLRISCPVTCSVGSDDKIVSVSELINYFTLVDKSAKLRVFKRARHEIHNEIKEIREEYFNFLRDAVTHSVYPD